MINSFDGSQCHCKRTVVVTTFSFNSYWVFGESRVFKDQRDGQIVNKLTVTAVGKLWQMEL